MCPVDAPVLLRLPGRRDRPLVVELPFYRSPGPRSLSELFPFIEPLDQGFPVYQFKAVRKEA
jgi:hypothetical protein